MYLCSRPVYKSDFFFRRFYRMFIYEGCIQNACYQQTPHLENCYIPFHFTFPCFPICWIPASTSYLTFSPILYFLFVFPRLPRWHKEQQGKHVSMAGGIQKLLDYANHLGLEYWLGVRPVTWLDLGNGKVLVWDAEEEPGPRCLSCYLSFSC